jgi:hypothetical protein
LDDAFDHLGARGVEQGLEFVQGGVDVGRGPAGQLHADDHGRLDAPDDVDALARRALLDDVAATTTFLGARELLVAEVGAVGQAQVVRGGLVVDAEAVDDVITEAVAEVVACVVRSGVVGTQGAVSIRPACAARSQASSRVP